MELLLRLFQRCSIEVTKDYREVTGSFMDIDVDYWGASYSLWMFTNYSELFQRV